MRSFFLRHLTAWLTSVFSISLLSAADPVFEVDSSNREEVRQFYRSAFHASEGFVPEWTGSHAGNPGSTSEPWKESVRLRVNFYRAMAGVPAWITFRDEFNHQAQHAALIMSSANALDHHPTPEWPNYTPEGLEGASNGNLALGSAGADAITGYMRDAGSANYLVGHRKWILHPPHREMGTGDIPATNGYVASNALRVFDGRTLSAYPPARDGFIAWPPKGYVPYTLNFPRWSFSAEGADLTQATVTMTRNGVPMNTVVEHNANEGFGAHLVWHAAGVDPNSHDPLDPAPDSDIVYTVTISGIGGSAAESYTYETIVFNPDTPTASEDLPQVPSGAWAWDEADNAVFIRAPEWAEAGRLRQLTLSETRSWTESVANNDRIVVPSGRTVEVEGIQTALLGHVQGGPDDELVYLSPLFVPGAGASLTFRHQLNFAGHAQTAILEASTNPDTQQWDILWSIQGQTVSGGSIHPLMESFEDQTIDLSRFENRTLHFRFRYERKPGLYMPWDDHPQGWTGWAIASISFNQVAEASVLATSAAPLNRPVTFQPAAGGTLHLQPGATAFGGLPLEWGTVQPFTVLEGEGHPFVAYPYEGSSWRNTPIGWIDDSQWPWIFSAAHQFLYAVEGSEIFLYDPGIASWIYTAPNLPSWFYSYRHECWLHFPGEPTAPGRWFYLPQIPDYLVDVALDGWVKEEQLWKARPPSTPRTSTTGVQN